MLRPTRDSIRTLLILVGMPIAIGVTSDRGEAQEIGTRSDSIAIMQVLDNWERGWEIYDPEVAVQDYSDDADWTNAFGMRRIGRDSIENLLTQVFQIATVTSGRTEYEYHDLRFLTADVALLRSRAIRRGQQLADGTPELRHIAHLRVFSKRNGHWQIVSHLIADERTPGAAR